MTWDQEGEACLKSMESQNTGIWIRSASILVCSERPPRNAAADLDFPAVDPLEGIDMTVAKPRTRRICVRLSEEEYFSLTNLCQITGARSVSDLTRDAMSDFLDGADAGQALENRMETLSAQLDTLIRKVAEIAEWIRSTELK